MQQRTFSRLAAALGVVLLSLGLAYPVNAAEDVSQTRRLPSFDRVHLRGAFTTRIVAGGPGTRVVVTTGSDAIDQVTTDVADGTLTVALRKGDWWANRTVRLTITVPTLRSFNDEGAGATTISGLTGGDLEITSAGAGTLTASGRAARLRITLEGAGKIDTTGVDARDVVVENDGAASARVRAAESLEATVNGVGVIRYTGAVRQVAQHVNGFGSISRI